MPISRPVEITIENDTYKFPSIRQASKFLGIHEHSFIRNLRLNSSWGDITVKVPPKTDA